MDWQTPRSDSAADEELHLSANALSEGEDFRTPPSGTVEGSNFNANSHDRTMHVSSPNDVDLDASCERTLPFEPRMSSLGMADMGSSPSPECSSPSKPSAPIVKLDAEHMDFCLSDVNRNDAQFEILYNVAKPTPCDSLNREADLENSEVFKQKVPVQTPEESVQQTEVATESPDGEASARLENSQLLDVDLSSLVDNFIADEDLMPTVMEYNGQQVAGYVPQFQGVPTLPIQPLPLTGPHSVSTPVLIPMQAAELPVAPPAVASTTTTATTSNIEPVFEATAMKSARRNSAGSGGGAKKGKARASGSAGRSRATTGSEPKRSDKRKPRTYSQAVPSQHCHICSRRPTEASPHAVCGNLLKGRCRKTICTKCFHQFRWDLKAAQEAPPGTWECPHCRGECPQRAQCVIYNRTSDRRRMKLINHRKRKAQDGTEGAKKGVKKRCLTSEKSAAESASFAITTKAENENCVGSNMPASDARTPEVMLVQHGEVHEFDLRYVKKDSGEGALAKIGSFQPVTSTAGKNGDMGEFLAGPCEVENVYHDREFIVGSLQFNPVVETNAGNSMTLETEGQTVHGQACTGAHGVDETDMEVGHEQSDRADDATGKEDGDDDGECLTGSLDVSWILTDGCEKGEGKTESNGDGDGNDNAVISWGEADAQLYQVPIGQLGMLPVDLDGDP